ncbi:MAG: hypothetical protein Ct9H300mP1_27680 [Planctomycetaceae bacterium]|nr:MAG: hypothetical protein Ct9H300mP1_27680 [Planctomycetaceae bacterium]
MIVVIKTGGPPTRWSSWGFFADRIDGSEGPVIVGTERTVIAAIGEKRNGEQETLSGLDEVDKVVPILAPYKVASRETKDEPTTVRALGLVLGGGHIGVIARAPVRSRASNRFLSPLVPSRQPEPPDFVAEPSSPDQPLFFSRDSRRRA